MFKKLFIVCLSALIYASPSFAQWTCNPSNCTTPTQMWPNNSANAKVGVGTNNPLAIFHSHQGTNSNFLLYNSLGGFGYAGVQINSNDDSGNNLNPLVFNASKHVFVNGNVGIGLPNPVYSLHIYNSGTNAPQAIVTQAANGGSNSYGDGEFLGDKVGISIRGYGSGFNAYTHVASIPLANMSEIWADQFVAESNAGLLIGTGTRSTAPLPPVIFATQSTERMRITGDGTIGFGTSTPDTRFRVDVSGLAKVFGPLASVYFADVSINTVSFGKIQGANPGASAAAPIIMQPDGGNLVIGQSGTKVGVNNTNPTANVDVTGTIHATGSITSDSGINAVYQDVAEWVPTAEPLSVGTVVVLNRAKGNEVMPSFSAYDTTVAGVVSEHPGIILGKGGLDKAQIATTGRVKVRVDASRGAIQIGDLLVTSDVSGAAMKSMPVEIAGVSIHRPGTIVGKALEPLASGSGEILVLLSLQ